MFTVFSKSIWSNSSGNILNHSSKSSPDFHLSLWRFDIGSSNSVSYIWRVPIGQRYASLLVNSLQLKFSRPHCVCPVLRSSVIQPQGFQKLLTYLWAQYFLATSHKTKYPPGSFLLQKHARAPPGAITLAPVSVQPDAPIQLLAGAPIALKLIGISSLGYRPPAPELAIPKEMKGTIEIGQMAA